MKKTLTLQKDYTLYNANYQLILPLDVEYRIPSDDPVRLLNQFIEGMFLGDLYRTYYRQEPGNHLNPRQMLKIVIYGYMNGLYSSRKIEEACRRDINFMWLMNGGAVPDHCKISRFRSQHLALCSDRIMAEVSEFLYELGEISGEAIFIDGTKIEACANKYTFVWKKAVTKRLQKLLDKLAAFVGECEELYGWKLTYKKQVKMKHVKKLRKKLYALKESEGITFVYGKGKRKSLLQKSIERLEEYQKKLKEYIKQLDICGERNSYSKTDPDATFMRMKEDAMGNGQLKAGYNIQHGTDSEYTVWLSVGPQPTDTTTLIPFLEEMRKNLSLKYTKIVADAGYESEENYSYLNENGQISFIKTTNYEISKTRKYKNDIGRAENMEYHAETDTYTCHNGKTLTVIRTRTEKTKTGYERETTIYGCADCKGCEYKKECIKGNHCNTPLEERNKNLYVSKKFSQYREENFARITGEEGCKLRINRNIQAEGSFGDLKQDMNFRRFLCRGTENVKAECVLHAMAHNIRKLHNKIQSGRTGTHLFPLKKSA